MSAVGVASSPPLAAVSESARAGPGPLELPAIARRTLWDHRVLSVEPVDAEVCEVVARDPHGGVYRSRLNLAARAGVLARP